MSTYPECNSNYIWTTWTSNGYTDSASATTHTYTSSTADTVWDTWVDNSTVCSGSTTDYVWVTWVGESTTGGRVYERRDSRGTVWEKWSSTYEDSIRPKVQTVSSKPLITIPRKSVEQLRAEKAQREIESEWQRYRYRELQREKEEAELLAQELLSDLIGEDQMEIYRDTGRLVVHGKKFDWLLRKDRTILKIDNSEARDFCVHLKDRHSYPETDNIITLALWVKENEKKLEKIANRNYSVETESVQRGGQAKLVEYNKIIKLRENKKEFCEKLQAASF